MGILKILLNIQYLAETIVSAAPIHICSKGLGAMQPRGTSQAHLNENNRTGRSAVQHGTGLHSTYHLAQDRPPLEKACGNSYAQLMDRLLLLMIMMTLHILKTDKFFTW